MGKKALRIIGVGLAWMAFMMVLSGCSGSQKEKTIAEIRPMDLSLMYDETDGYHIPDLHWDMEKKDVEEVLDISLGKKTEGLMKTYYLDNGDIEKIYDYTTSSVDYAFSPKGSLVNVTYNFSTENYSSEELDNFYERVKTELAAHYGAAGAEEQSETEQGKKTFYTDTCKWEKPLKDGQMSTLQAAKANTGEKTEVVSVGVAVYQTSDENSASVGDGA